MSSVRFVVADSQPLTWPPSSWRSLKGVNSEPLAERLLKQLQKNGIRSLDDLKKRIDAWGSAKSKQNGSSTNGADGLTSFIKKLGLVDESAGLVVDGKPQKRSPARTAPAAAPEPSHRPVLPQALFHLRSSTLEEVRQHLIEETADDAAVRELAAASVHFIDALSLMRAAAVDRELLGTWRKSGPDPDDVCFLEGSQTQRASASAVLKRPAAADREPVLVVGAELVAEPAAVAGEKRVRLRSKVSETASSTGRGRAVAKAQGGERAGRGAGRGRGRGRGK